MKKPSGRAAPVAAPSPALASARANRGAISSAASMIMPWKKSVQHTALKPPRKAAMYMATVGSMSMTVLNRVPQALMEEAA